MERESCLHNFDLSLGLSLELQNKLSQKDTKRLNNFNFKMIMSRYWFYEISMGYGCQVVHQIKFLSDQRHFKAVFRIRIRIRIRMDPHIFDKKYADPDPGCPN